MLGNNFQRSKSFNICTTKTGSLVVLNNQLQQSSDQLSNKEMTEGTSKKKRSKFSKGLRHFSMRVAEKVKSKKMTTYRQVADELVNEYCSQNNKERHMSAGATSHWTLDQKNVRRRVYDALNVLMAMNIISKQRKEISWIGLPSNKKQECQELEIEKKNIEDRIKSKSETLKNLLLEHIAFKSMVEHNKAIKAELNDPLCQVRMPFVVINTDAKTSVELNISPDRKEYCIQFDNAFKFSSHIDVLEKLGYMHGLSDTHRPENQTTTAKTKTEIDQLSSYLPKAFEPYVQQLEQSGKIDPITFKTHQPDFSSLTVQSKESKRNVKEGQSGASGGSRKRSRKQTDVLLVNDDDDMYLENFDENDEDTYDDYDEYEDFDEDEEFDYDYEDQDGAETVETKESSQDDEYDDNDDIGYLYDNDDNQDS